MKKRLFVLTTALVFTALIFGPLAAMATTSQTPGPTISSMVLDLSTFSRLGLEGLPIILGPGGDGGGPTLDQIMLDDVDTGGGSGKVHWIFELLQGSDDSEYLIRPVQGCASGRQLENEWGTWKVSVALDVPSEPTGLIVLDGEPGIAGGTARGEVEIPIQVRFENQSSGTVKVVDHQVIYYLRGPWAATAGPDAWESSTPFAIDTDCDGVSDAEAAPTTGAPALGWFNPSAGGRPVRGTVCGAGEEMGGWLCASPALRSEHPTRGTGESDGGGPM